jgi:hypothetical protein
MPTWRHWAGGSTPTTPDRTVGLTGYQELPVLRSSKHMHAIPAGQKHSNDAGGASLTRKEVHRLLPYALAVLVLLLAYALRVHRLGVKDFWWDEAHSWKLATYPLLEAIRRGLALVHDPFYLVPLHFWIRLTGSTEFGLRYFSLLIMLLSVAYLGRITTRAFGRRAGMVALLIGAISPLWIFYAQEVRHYAPMPILMLGMVESVVDIRQGRDKAWWTWGRLVIAEALGLYTHNFMLFGVVGVHAAIGWMWLREVLPAGHRAARIRESWLWRWLASQGVVLALTVPMIPVYVNRGLSSGLLVGSTLNVADLWNAVWHNWMGIPWEDVGPVTPLQAASWVVLALFCLGLAILLHPRADVSHAHRRLAADLFWLVAAGTGTTLAFWLVNSKIHPRYLIMMSGPLFALLAWVLAVLWDSAGGRTFWMASRRGAALVLAGALAFVAVRGSSNIYSGATFGYRHDATRAMTAYLRENFGAGDGIVALDPYDSTLDFYDTGPVPLFRAGFDDGVSTPADLAAFMRGKDRVAVLRFHAERSDTRRIAAFYLERFGRLEGREDFEAYTVYTYRLDTDARPEVADFEPVNLHWEELSLVGQSLAAWDAVTVALRWQAAPELAPGRRYAALVRLIDPQTGWQLSSASGLLMAEGGIPTAEWSPGQTATQYLILPLLPGTPPIGAEIRITLLDAQTGQALDAQDANGTPIGQQTVLGQVRIGSSPQRWEYDDPPPLTLTRVESGYLSAYATDWPTTTPGGRLGVALGWLAEPYRVVTAGTRLQLVQDGVILAEDDGPPLQGRQPADVPTGTPWLDLRALQVSGEAESGPADLVLWVGDERVTLGQVEILGFERITERPVAEAPHEATFGDAIRLLGYRLDVPDPLTGESVLVLTLYWQASADGEPGKNYVVFTHILSADGRLVGQHDGVPVYGARPTGGWLQGEYLIDEHPMTFGEPYAGPIRIQVGLYDPVTLERLLTDDGLDAVSLPIEGLEVESGP